MRAPAYWQNPPDKPGWQARALAPLSAVYARATANRVAKPPTVSPDCPTICVGNLTAGGNGKTPTVIWLLENLDRTFHVVTRGYGGALDGPVRVDPKRHTAEEVGDEPLLLAAFAPVWMAKNRAAGAKAAIDGGAPGIILDDGFQNPAVRYHKRIIVADAANGFGNGRVIPAGPLREPVAAGMARADLLLTIGDARAQARFDAQWGHAVTVPQARAEMLPLETGMDWSDMRAVAFAGIGYPEKFFATLRSMGADVVHTEALDDHQPLTPPLLKRLITLAVDQNARLVTTEKDAVRLPPALRTEVFPLPVRLQVADRDLLLGELSFPEPHRG